MNQYMRNFIQDIVLIHQRLTCKNNGHVSLEATVNFQKSTW